MSTNSQEKWIGIHGKQRFIFLAAALLLGLAGGAHALDANTLPTGGTITAGSGAISQTGSQMTIDQASQKLIANWSTFNIGQDAAVRFNQPGSSAVALNRIQDQNPSQILGALSANGQIYLLNPAGIIFGKTAQVNVGGLVASSLDLSDADFLSGNNRFATVGTAGAILNQGTIRTADGGYVAFLAPKVENSGAIESPNGTVMLAAGDRVSLDFTGDQLVTYTVEQGAIDALAENHGLIKADGGLVVMTAEAADQLTGAVVNSEGVIQAQTLANQEGRILLLADMESGMAMIGGNLDASAPDGGDGGFIETSAASVQVADDAKVTTLAASGQTGEWLIDPTDYTIAASGGDMSGAELSGQLATTNITLQSSQGAMAGSGDINIEDTVSWSADTTLTLTASNNVNINADITATGNGAGLNINPNTANGAEAASSTGTFNLGTDAVITLSGSSPSLTIAGNSYTVINSAAALQGISYLDGLYALGSDIDLASIANFAPIGGFAAFYGTFNGLNHAISNFRLSLYSSYVGMFARMNGTLANLHVSGIVQGGGLGSLAGVNAGEIINCSFTGEVSSNGNNSLVGGLVSRNFGTIVDSHVDASVSTNGYLTGAGGLVGQNFGTILNSFATGNVSMNAGYQSMAGGLVGRNDGTIANSYATGHIFDNSVGCIPGLCFGYNNVGGLVGANYGGTITNAHASGNVDNIGVSSNVGGLAGASYIGVLSNVYAMGNVSAGSSSATAGGLLGFNGGSLSAAYATGNVGGGTRVGGLVGQTTANISNSYATGDVQGTGTYVGGLAGLNDAYLIDSYATGNVIGGNNVGGLVGHSNYGGLTRVYATGSVSGNQVVGGLAGSNYGTVTDAYANGSVTGNMYIGGLAGYNNNYGTLNRTYASGLVTLNPGGSYAGGLVGYTYWGSQIYNSYWDTQTTGQSLAIGRNDGVNTATPGTTAQMTRQAGYASWDFTNTWRIYEGYSYPVLRSLQQPLLTVTASNDSKTYDGLTYSGGKGVAYSVAGASLDGMLSYGGSSQGAIDAGSYAITPQIAMTQQDYQNWAAVNFVDGTLAIDPAALTVTASNDSKTYDGLAYSGGNGVTYSGFVTGEDASVLGGTLAYGGSSQGAVDAGSYVIAPSGLNSSNYTITFNDGTLTVDPAALMVTANNDAKNYDGLAYSGGNGVVYSGFVTGEDVSVLGGTLSYGGSSQGANLPGNYTIVPGGLTSGNYVISYLDGTLTIENPAPAIGAIVASLTSSQSALNGTHQEQYGGFDPASTQETMGPGGGSGTFDSLAAGQPVEHPCVGAMRDSEYCR